MKWKILKKKGILRYEFRSHFVWGQSYQPLFILRVGKPLRPVLRGGGVQILRQIWLPNYKETLTLIAVQEKWELLKLMHFCIQAPFIYFKTIFFFVKNYLSQSAILNLMSFFMFTVPKK